jgi:C-terminal processing protease CtpA/Prc
MTPDRKNIDKKGLEPDIKVEMDSNKIGDKEDIQLKKAEEYLLEYIKS